MLKKLGLLVGVVALAGAAMMASAPGALAWKGVAANDYGYAFAYGYSEAEAKLNAIDACLRDTGYRCPQATSERDHWSLVVIRCNDNGDYMTAASQYGVRRAADFAARKLNRTMYGCWVQDSW